MLTTLGPTPTLIVIIPQPRPQLRARWIGNRPRLPHRPPGTARVRLAPGVWVVPAQHWLPASALDIGEDLPVPSADVVPQHFHLGFGPPEWQTHGLCAQLPVDVSDSLFFGIENREAPGRLIAAANQARNICARCPIEAACLSNALINDERYGVWGGTSGRQREKLRLRLVNGASVDELVRECLPGRQTA